MRELAVAGQVRELAQCGGKGMVMEEEVWAGIPHGHLWASCLPSLNFSFLSGIQMEAKYLPSGAQVRLSLDTAYRASGF